MTVHNTTQNSSIITHLTFETTTIAQLLSIGREGAAAAAKS